jgi:hypothetical protein
MKMENKFELTLIEALCVLSAWSTGQEEELYNYARKIVQKENDKLHLKYQLYVVNSKLDALK